jgi:hypothetical protein
MAYAAATATFHSHPTGKASPTNPASSDASNLEATWETMLSWESERPSCDACQVAIARDQANWKRVIHGKHIERKRERRYVKIESSNARAGRSHLRGDSQWPLA